jgi:hypothetical protein
MLRFIVTGTGRCGTVYMARVLTSIGVPCGHEGIFNNEPPDIVENRFLGKMAPRTSQVSENFGWLDESRMIADSSYMAVPYLKKFNVPLIHVVRNPFDVISSFIKDLKYFNYETNNFFNAGGWENFIFYHLPGLKKVYEPIERACYFYLEWNERIEAHKDNRPYYFHKIEDDFSDELFGFLNVKPQKITFRNKKINTMKKRDKNFAPEDIPDGEIKDRFLNMVARYGYTANLLNNDL